MNTYSLFQFLDQLCIQYECHEHVAVYTSEQARRLISPLPGAPAKNLFLKDKKGSRYFLLTLADMKTVDLKSLAARLGLSKLSLASANQLMEILGIEPGAVSLLSLVNDTSCKVEVLVDQDLWQKDKIQCHPLVNTATLVISRQDIIKFLDATRHLVKLVEIDQSSI